MNICLPFVTSLYAIANHERGVVDGNDTGIVVLWVHVAEHPITTEARVRLQLSRHTFECPFFTRLAYSACAAFPTMHIVHVWSPVTDFAMYITRPTLYVARL